jgi:beta-glucosidase-like glycosyl hydrolase
MPPSRRPWQISEDPYHSGQYGSWYTQGLQWGNDTRYTKAIGALKHYTAYVHTHVHTNTNTRTQTHTRHTHTDTHTHTLTQTDTHTRTHARSYTHIHTRT